jgi:hypothetical protein
MNWLFPALRKRDAAIVMQGNYVEKSPANAGGFAARFASRSNGSANFQTFRSLDLANPTRTFAMQRSLSPAFDPDEIKSD